MNRNQTRSPNRVGAGQPIESGQVWRVTLSRAHR
jgi:hypothetical protein